MEKVSDLLRPHRFHLIGAVEPIKLQPVAVDGW
jgi:hypothetical protein